MDTSTTSRLLIDAVQKLENVHAELNRPEEDVVSYTICVQVKQSLNGMFRSYLAYKKEVVDEEASLLALFDRCKEHCSDFGFLDISRVICNAGKPYPANEGCLGPTHCMSFEEYHHKVKFATSVRDIVLNEMKVSEGNIS
jgi:hypothetical protein